MRKAFVLDTNIILNDHTMVNRLSEEGKNIIIIPETVLDELDDKKSGFEDINFQARSFARFLESYSEPIDTRKLDGYTIVRTQIDDHGLLYEIHIILKDSYIADQARGGSSYINDRKILEVAKFVTEEYSDFEIVFLSLDIMARTRAISMSIPTETVYGDFEENRVLEFVKEIIYDGPAATLDNMDIFELDPEHKQENYSYSIKSNITSQTWLGMVQHGRIKILTDEMYNTFVPPKNSEQRFFITSILDPYYNICISNSKAGSGKTLLAVTAAMKLIDCKDTDYNRIVYIRNSIESLDKGEDVGYLKGNEEKFIIYNYPLFDTMSYIANKFLQKQVSTSAQSEKYGKASAISSEAITEKMNDLIAQYGIETMWVGAMRGRTLSNSLVIIDEAQNCSQKTMSLILSRIDHSCKVIVLGSNKQIDNVYLNKHINGLNTLINCAAEPPIVDGVNLFGIELKKVLRGKITEFSELVFGDVKTGK